MRNFICLAAACLLLIACDDGSGTDAGAPDGGGIDGSIALCGADRDCGDQSLFCAQWRCRPGEAGTDARGCINLGAPCADGEGCDEEMDRCGAPAWCTEGRDGCLEPGDCDGDGAKESLECGGDDCDDDDPNRFPGNPEVCDAEGHDEDCNPETVAGPDDGDRDGDSYISAMCCNGEHCGDDCDDTLREVFPGAREICNGIDDDCDGEIDEAGAFCPVGTCVNRRCQGLGWERVYGTAASFDPPFGLEVDRDGNVYAGITIGGGLDLDGDGLPEPGGSYVISIAAEGRVRWHTDSPAGARSIAMLGDDSAFAVASRSEVRIYWSSNGALVDTIILEPFGRWEHVRIVGAVRAAGELVIAANAVIEEEVPDPWDPWGPPSIEVVESALVLIRYDTARTEVGRRIIELTGEKVRGGSIGGSQGFLAINVASSAPLDLGTGELPSGSALAVLRPDLSTVWSREAAIFEDIAVSETGAAAGVGAYHGRAGYPWAPPWTSETFITDPNPAGGSAQGGYAVSFDEMGNHLWTRAHGKAGPVEALSFFLGVSYDGRDNLFVSGYFSGTMDVTPQPALMADVHEPPAIGECDAFYALWPVRDGGDFTLMAREIEGTQCEVIYAVRVDAFGGMVILGDFAQTLILPSGARYDSAGGRDAFLLRIASLTP